MGVFAPTQTPYGVIQPNEISTVVNLDVGDDKLIVVRWTCGECFHDFRNLAAGD